MVKHGDVVISVQGNTGVVVAVYVLQVDQIRQARNWDETALDTARRLIETNLPVRQWSNKTGDSFK